MKPLSRPKNWPAASVEMWAIDRLKAYARNARTHSAEQVAQIAASMREWGFTVPILAQPDGTIIAGHGRHLAAQQLGLAELPVMIARGWTEAQVRAYVLADNKLAANAGWDEDLLKIELGELSAAGFDVGITGFSDEELAAINAIGAGAGRDPDEVPQEPARAVAQAGDVWLLGSHRLVCGDATDEAAVEACVGHERPHLMVTDPPYGVNYDPGWRNAAGTSKTSRTGKVLNDDRADWRDAWALFPGDVAYVWHSPLHPTTVAESLIASGFAIRSQIIWAKERLVLSRGDYHWQHEPCWYAVRDKATGHWSGDRTQTTLWSIPSRDHDAATAHGTQKPVECMRRPINNNSKTGDAVYDPFCGSGTTIIAAEMTGRRCMAIELNPVYVDMAIQRWQAFAGRDARLEASGKTYDETMHERYDANADGLGSYEVWMAEKRKTLAAAE